MLLFLSLTSIVLSIILLYYNHKTFKSALYLGFFFLLISIYGLIQYALMYSHSKQMAGIFYVNFTFLTYLIGPALYWYIRSVLNDDTRLKKRDFWHVVPAIIYLIPSIPHIFSPWSEKIAEASSIINSIGFLARNKPTLLYHLIPNMIIHISRPFIVLVYVLLSAVLLLKFLAGRSVSAVFSNQRWMIKWIVILLGLTFILASSQIFILREAYIDRNSKLFFTANLSQIISAIGLVGLLIAPFFFPIILYGLPRFPAPVQPVRKAQNNALSDNGSKKVTTRALESEYIAMIENKLGQCMLGQQLYLMHECNLVNAARCMDLPVHHLAYYFREVKKQSFNDYRNELRLDHAKQLIREGKAKELTLEGIALQSGFSTRNTFFKAFKKIEGETPGSYSSRFPG